MCPRWGVPESGSMGWEPGYACCSSIGMETREINLSVSQGTGTEMGTGMVNGSHALLFHWGKTLSSF